MPSETQHLLRSNQAVQDISDLFNNVDLAARPKELELELDENEDYLAQQYNSLVISQTINNFKKDIIQNTQHHESDLDAARMERTRQLNILRKYQEKLQQLQHNINSSIASLETDKNTILSSQQEAETLDEEIIKMEAKINQVNEASSHTLEYTADEAKVEIGKATEAFAELASVHDQVSEVCDDKTTIETRLRAEVVHLAAKQETFARDAQIASNTYQVADKTTEEECKRFRKYTDILSRIAGIEEIVESNRELKVVYAPPYNTQLLVSYDVEDGSKITGAKITGNTKIKDLVEIAKSMNYIDGVNMMVAETLFRLQNKHQI